MNWRAFGGLVRREVLRGRQGIRVLTAIGLVAIACTLLLSADVATIVGALCTIPAVLTMFLPLSDLRTDKTQGFVEFDRVLPVSHRAIATARMFGAALRTLPMLLLVAPLIISLYRDRRISETMLMALLATIPAASWIVLTAFMWLLMAINMRWNLRRLWWLPMTIGFTPTIVRSILPPPWKRAMAVALTGFFERNSDAALAFVGSPAGVASVALILVAVVSAIFFGTVTLFASGIERYTYDASAAVEMRPKPPKLELGAIGRGPSLAVARYCIRLAAEQSWRRFILLGVFIVVLLFGTVELKRYAQFYVRALAAMIPGGIALQLSVARTRGHLEGVQQLPHPAITIGLGYLLGIALLATPGAAVWILARAVTGTPPTVTGVLSLWGWMVGWSWFACVTVVWLTTRRLLMIAAVPVVALASWAAYIGLSASLEHARSAGATYAAFRTTAGAALPLSVACAMIVLGLPLFARGLTEFEFSGARKATFWRRFTSPRTSSA